MLSLFQLAKGMKGVPVTWLSSERTQGLKEGSVQSLPPSRAPFPSHLSCPNPKWGRVTVKSLPPELQFPSSLSYSNHKMGQNRVTLKSLPPELLFPSYLSYSNPKRGKLTLKSLPPELLSHPTCPVQTPKRDRIK